MMEQQAPAVRGALSDDAKELFDDVATQRVLGASSHIDRIGRMFLDLCGQCGEDTQAETLRGNITELADFFVQTRGKASQGISNAIRIMTAGIDAPRTAEELRRHMEGNVKGYHRKNEQDLEAILDYAKKLLEGMKNVLLFDYSSTVGKLVEASAGMRDITYYIPESRALDGGRPYIKQCVASGHEVRFIPDASIYYYLKECDGVFIGAETFYADGRVFNTVGSEMTAYLCRRMGVPFYVLTSLIKLDSRAQYGYVKPPVVIDLKGMLSRSLAGKEADGVDFTCPELVEIPAEHIAGMVTEKGILPYYAVYGESMEFLKRIGTGDV